MQFIENQIDTRERFQGLDCKQQQQQQQQPQKQQGKGQQAPPLNNSPRHLQLKPLRQEKMANNNNKQLEEGEEASEPKEAEEEVSEEVLEVVSGEETEEPITTIAKRTAPV